MRVRGAVIDFARLGLCWAASFGAALGLAGCGASTSDPHSEAPENTGGLVQAGGQSAGDAGIGEAARGGRDAAGGAAGSAGTEDGLGGAAAAAGTSGNGAAGETARDPALANLPLPARCKPLSGAETELLCSLSSSCGAVTGTNSCYQTASGWQCTCEAPNSNRTYLVKGAEGLKACAVAAGLCSGGAPALDPTTCVTTHEVLGGSEGSKSCTLDLSCQTPVPIDFAPTVRATLYGGGTVKCLETPAQNPKPGLRRVDCEANGKGESKSYAAVANDVADACLPVLRTFLAPPEPQFEGYTSCVREAPDTGRPSDCQLIETCFDSAPLAADVSLVRSPHVRDMSCGFDDAGSLSCGCGWETTRDDPVVPHRDIFSFELGPAAKPATCDFSRCPLDIHAEPTGPGDCPWGDTTDGHDSCQGFFSCRRPATLDGQSVIVNSQLNTLCEQAADQSIYCGCTVGDETATFRLDDGSSMADACTLARVACLERVVLPVGRASYPSVPPDPLPTP